MNEQAIKISKTEDQDRLFRELVNYCTANLPEKDLKKITDAYELAKRLLDGAMWGWGEPILLHSIEVARIAVTEIGLSTDSVVSALLHNVFDKNRKQEISFKDVQKQFGRSVRGILEGIYRINEMDTETVSIHSENYRRLMLALSGDVRVILIKIADRLRDMRTIDWVNKEMQNKYATETSYLYAPLAHRLGLYQIKSELEDRALKYLNPDIYSYIVTRLEETRKQRERFVAGFVKPIEQKLKRKGFDFEMKSRTKSIYSIWNKMNTQKVSFDEVYDLFAIRVIINSQAEYEKSDCWQVYSIVTEEYQPNPERLRDWISIPKSNGYESLHTTVMGPEGKWVEIQIRTQRMDEIAEKGLAAHWKYKGGRGSEELDNWLANIREIMESKETSVVDFIDDFQRNIYDDEIFVFTPKGDLRKLSKGATLLDFAYDIHSQVGDRCIGGKVNGRIVTLKYKLQNGDQIEIETSKKQKPKTGWLDFVSTSKAKNRIKASLNEEQRREAENGKEIILRKFKNWKLDFNDEVIKMLIKHYKLKYAVELYSHIATEKIDPLEIKEIVIGQKEEETGSNRLKEMLPESEVKELRFSKGDDYLIIDNNINNVVYKFAPCCNPIPGDKIFGFVTIKEGIKIHRQSCPNSHEMIERYPYRVIKAQWKEMEKQNAFQATIKISGNNQVSLIGDITQVLAHDFQVQIRSISVNPDNKGEFDGTIRIFVFDTGHLDFVIQRLKQVKGVRYVTRVDF